VDAPDTTLAVELERGSAHDRDRRRAADPRQLELQSPRQRHVVRIQPGDVRPTRHVEATVERTREAELDVAAQDSEPGIVDRGEDIVRPIGRRVVDDDEFELREGLSEDARERRSDIRRAVVHGEEDGDERGGRHGPAVAYGPCRASLRRSTSSSRQ
jgi:hypothetical protein